MSNIHPTATVDGNAQVADDAVIGPYCVVGPDARIGSGVRLISHAVIDGRTTLGAGCTVFPFASIGTQTQDLKFKGGRTFVEIGEKTTIREYVTVNSGTNEGEVTRVGANCHIMAYCHVAHACRVGDGVIMANGASLAGECEVGDQAVLGGMSGFHQFVKVGKMCMIGGMSRITQDCPPFMLIEGNPPKVYGPNVVKLERTGVSPETRKLLKDCYKLLYRSGLATNQALERIKAEMPMEPEIRLMVEFLENASRQGILKASV